MIKNKFLRRTVPAISLALLAYFGAGSIAYAKPQTVQVEQREEAKTYKTELEESFAKLEAKLEGFAKNGKKPTVTTPVETERVKMFLPGGYESKITTETSLDASLEKLLKEYDIDKEKLIESQFLSIYFSRPLRNMFDKSCYKQFKSFEEFIRAHAINDINSRFNLIKNFDKQLNIIDEELRGLSILLKIDNVPNLEDYMEKVILPSGVDYVISVKTQDAFSASVIKNFYMKRDDKEKFLKDTFFVEDYQKEVFSLLDSQKEAVFAELKEYSLLMSIEKNKDMYSDEELQELAETYISFQKLLIKSFMHDKQPIAMDIVLPQEKEDGTQPRLAGSVIGNKTGEYYIWMGSSATPYKEWKDFALKVAENLDNLYK